MLALRDTEAFVVFTCAGLAAFLLGGLIHSLGKGRTQRLKLLESALQHPALDEATRRALLQALAEPPGLGRIFSSRMLTAAGWIGVFVGLGCLLSGDRDGETAGPIIAMISFGVLTVPFALREVEARRQSPAPRRPG